MFKLKRFYFICWICSFHVFIPAVRSQNLDIDLLKSINPQNPQAGVWKSTTNSYILVSGGVSLGSLAYAFIKNDKELKSKSYELLLGIGINIVATQCMKTTFQRTRPHDQYPNEIFVLTTTNGRSFPSGHTSLAFATATSLALTHKKWYIVLPAYVWAGGVGYSRMYLGKHYPTDVLAGAMVGVGSSLLSHWVSKKLFYPKKIRPAASQSLY